MSKSGLIAAAMAAGLTLSACASDEADDTTTDDVDAVEQTQDTGADTDVATATSDTDVATATADAGAGMADPACTEFFTEGGPLADRADAAREALSNGEVVDLASYGEVNLLEQRIASAGEGAPENISALLEEVNAPFTEAVTAVNEGAMDAETGEITLPEIDVEPSAQAQAELEEACQG